MDNTERQADEWDALESIYGDEVGALEKISDTDWKISLTREAVTGQASSFSTSTGSGSGDDIIATLFFQLPPQYPSSLPPKVSLKAPQWIVDETRLKQWEAELTTELYSPDMEAVIVMTEHLKGLLLELFESEETGGALAMGKSNNSNCNAVGKTYGEADEEADDESAATRNNSKASATNMTRTFVPSSTKFHQPTRVFDTAIIDSQEHTTIIHAGTPFHPPKSGPAELLQAFVARVISMEQVEWTLANLLLENKKVAKASHNMYAYRFHRRTCTDIISKSADNDKNKKNQIKTTTLLVSDSDDDGEKGSGAKLASLLELTNSMDCIVIVSRWYGGIHLGPARFKWIANVGRDALEEFGLLGE